MRGKSYEEAPGRTVLDDAAAGEPDDGVVADDGVQAVLPPRTSV